MSLSFILEIFIIALASFVQLTNAAFFNAVKPDLALALLLAMAAYDKRWERRISWLIVAALILKFMPQFDIQALFFVLAALIGMLIIDYLPWRHWIGVVVAVIAGTLVVNFKLFGLEWGATFTEMLYNVPLALLLTYLASLAYGKKEIR